MCIRDKDIGALWRIMNVDYNMTLRIHNFFFNFLLISTIILEFQNKLWSDRKPQTQIKQAG